MFALLTGQYQLFLCMSCFLHAHAGKFETECDKPVTTSVNHDIIARNCAQHR